MSRRRGSNLATNSSLALSDDGEWMGTDEEFEKISKEITQSNGLTDEDSAEELWVPKDMDWENEF